MAINDREKLEADIEKALTSMSADTRRALADWCAEHELDERSAVARLAGSELDRRFWRVFGDLTEMKN